MKHTYSLQDFIKANRSKMLKHLRETVEQLKEQMALDPQTYTHHDADHDYLAFNIRLCVDYLGNGRGGDWTIYTGDSSFDAVHYPLCGSGIVESDTDAKELFKDLIDQICDQATGDTE